MKGPILDTGPLVAWFCPRDVHHPWAVKVFQKLGAGCFICEAVLTEVCHLVAKEGIARERVIGEVERGGMVLIPLAGELAALRKLLKQYQDIEMDFADACVVRLAELHEGISVCTSDSDFKVYRRHGRQEIPLVAPWI